MAEKVLRELNDMKATGALCDVVLQGAEESSVGIPCHRNVLSASSPYFRTMFTSGLRESSESTIKLKNISAGTLNELVNYAYTLEIQIDADSVQAILIAALFLDIVPVTTSCWDYMEKHMDISSCLMVHCLAEQLNNAPLAAKAKAMVLRGFAQVCRSADFLAIEAEKVIELITSDDLHVDKEDGVLEAVMRWVEHDQVGRKVHLSDLLQFVRVGYLGSASQEKYFLMFLNGFLNSPAVDLPLSSGIMAAIPNRQAQAIASRCRPRESYGLWKAIVCVGELDNMDTGCPLEVFIPSTSSVVRFASLPGGIDGPGLAVLENGSLLACGGASGHHNSENRVWRYNAARFTWSEVAPMNERRFEAGVTALHGCIYAVGGDDMAADQPALSSMESYDPQENRWRLEADLPDTLMLFAIVAIDNRLFVFGGKNSRGEILNSVYCYDPIANIWSKMANMPTPRSCCTACVGPSGLIYVIGGGNNARGTKQCVEAYDPTTNQWQKKRNTTRSRYSAVSACVDGKIFVMGGKDRSIEYYDEDTDTWTLHNCLLPEGKYLTGCAVMTMKPGEYQTKGADK
ncbi:kelch-like protein 1 isoform X2 [Paramacrobiotus metropolitanus]|uniref:kelch-like protein 1 isoform X2 n=1 Tax=Paramacrobiotus metropolitanus TaxID=2943436 RepID=UPI00244582A1|nr:kelch-like protein 1 isoform X2 [Paramacrobiotus metropolitanus]